jgi:hypothetical protein
VKRVTIELGDLTQHNLKQLKVLNRDVFPVAYNEKFYKDLLGAGELCRLGMLEIFLSQYNQKSIWWDFIYVID